MPPSIAASIVFLGVSLTLFQIKCGTADDDNNTAYDLRYKDCSTTTGNSSSNSNSLYHMNLRRFLAALPSSAINNSGFFNGTVGSLSTGMVFGMAMCQVDIQWPHQCDRCLQAASAEAPKACPSSSNAAVAYRGCVLRYSDAPILAVANDDIANGCAFYTQNHASGVLDTAAFGQTRKDLFASLASATVVSPLMIASGNRTFNSTHKLYGLAQCNRDLPRELCSYLIMSIIENIPSFAAEIQWSEGVSITGFSFYIRYDLTPFAVYVSPTGTGSLPPAETVKDVTPTGTGIGPSQQETVKGGSVNKVKVTVIIVVAILFCLMAFSIIMMGLREKERNRGSLLGLAGIIYFPYGDIKSATNNFDGQKFLGEGSFGKVYKGTFSNIDKELAVKCVTKSSAAKQLKDELKLLAKLEHRNVVQMVGFCNNDGWFRRGRGLYVCNEYIRNGTLDKYIFVQPVIEWRVRYQIIHGICAGLQYLHQDRNNNIAHMDIKPSNILLDENMKPKIADFGISRAFWNDKTHTYTTNVRGTNGYIATELLERGKVSHACDIYSLGVVILAIVMGEGPTAMRDPGGVMFINKVRLKFIIDLQATTPNMICRAMDREQLKKDASLQNGDCIEDVEKCVGLAFKCVNEKPEDRPKATDICTLLNQVIPSDNEAHTSHNS